ncbi:MAG: hypothetical protein M1132_00520 [Chloroflexi bacterium]|nr:hypothetical protein [Chloroflexota bacterium]
MSPRRAIPQKKKKSALPRWLVVTAALVVVAGVVIVGVDLFSKLTSAPVPPPTGVAESGRTKGDPKAPIAFVEFSDFQ